LDGAAVVALAAVGIAAVVESDGEIRVEPDRLVVVLDGAVILVLAAVGGAAVVEGAG